MVCEGLQLQDHGRRDPRLRRSLHPLPERGWRYGHQHLGARTGERLGPGDASAHHGLEHFGFDSTHLETDIKRLEGLGARLLEGPIQNPNGSRIAFVWAPDDVRVELVEPRKVAGGSGGCC